MPDLLPSNGRLPGPLANLPIGLQAAIWMMLASLFFAGMNGIIKHATVELHPFEVVFFRTFFGLAWMLPWLFRRGIGALHTGRHAAYSLRGALGMIGMLTSFYTYAHVPLADATALSFTAPLFATMGAALFLGEVVRLRRWTATVMGFVGVLVIVQPGTRAFDPVALFMLLSAATSAVNTLLVKSLSRTESPDAIALYMTLYLTPMALVPAIFVWEWPSWTMLGWMVLLGMFGSLGHICWNRSFALADASAVMPYEYVRLPLAALIGFVFFAEVPEVWTYVGTAIIAGSSLYIAHREAQVARSARLATKVAQSVPAADPAAGGVPRQAKPGDTGEEKRP